MKNSYSDYCIPLLIVAHAMLGSLNKAGVPVDLTVWLAFPQCNLMAFWLAFAADRHQGWAVLLAFGGLTLLYCCAGPLVLSLNFMIYFAFEKLLKLNFQKVEGDTTTGADLQFSIRQLMMITVAVACSLGIARAIRETSVPEMLGGLYMLAAILVIGPLASAATLGRSNPLLPSLVVVLVSALIAVASVFALGRERPEWYAWVTLNFVVNSLILLASFFVVRSAGYRLLPAGESRKRGAAAIQEL